MSDNKLPDYDLLTTELKQAGIAINAAELHGLLTGMLSGGVVITDKTWQAVLFDYTNDGLAWPSQLLQQAETLLELTHEEVSELSLSLSLVIPDSDDSADLIATADGVADWVSHFISGLGLSKAEVKKGSATAKEALGDLEEISKLGVDEDDDLQEQAELLEHVIEHVKACALAIHAEFAVRVEQPKQPTLH
ncbi:MAG: YecA family protein [Vibrio sp.]